MNHNMTKAEFHTCHAKVTTVLPFIYAILISKLKK